MPCFRPVLAYRGRHNSETGKRPLVFNPKDGFSDLTVTIPCGQCLGCRLEKARQWKVRIMHESQLHEHNSFVTLTYAPEYLPEGGTLVKRDLQLFFKRLRKRVGAGIKYYAVGEYGSELSRPHYHICLFGFDFPDKSVWKADVVASRSLYRSALLEEVWPFGYSSVGSLTPESAGYVARYVNKKITGVKAADHYGDKLAEFALMSRGGRSGHGIAYEWFNSFSSDVFPKDFVTIRGRKERPPRYYDGLFEKSEPDLFKEVKAKRLKSASENEESLRRLAEREKARSLQVEKFLHRHFEEAM